MDKRTREIIRISLMAMLTAISVVSLNIFKFPLIPSAPFLEYDAADIPVLLGTAILGTAPGMLILLTVCLIQAFTVSAMSGIIGGIMHFSASAVLVLVTSLVYKKNKNTKSLAFGLLLGSISMVLVMIPLNLVFTGIFLNAGTSAVAGMLIPAIIPFNALKAGINSAVTFAVFVPCSKAIKLKL